MTNKLAVILIRGLVRIQTTVKDTLKMLNIERKHVCVVIEDTPSARGMINKCKDYVTWGEIDSATEKILTEKRGVKGKDGKLKKYFRLSPPRGGFERKGIKKDFTVSGALGYRGNKINDLIKKMI